MENQRQIQLENISFDFHSKMDINRGKTELLIKERKITQNNAEEDTKKALINLLNHLREIKNIRRRLCKIDEQKAKLVKKEREIVLHFKRRNQEIELMNDIITLNMIKQYSNQLYTIHMNSSLEDDEMRLKGLELIGQLK